MCTSVLPDNNNPTVDITCSVQVLVSNKKQSVRIAALNFKEDEQSLQSTECHSNDLCAVNLPAPNQGSSRLGVNRYPLWKG